MMGNLMALFTEKVDSADSVFRISGANTSRKRKRSTGEEFKEYLEHEQERNKDNSEFEQSEEISNNQTTALSISPLAGLDIVDIRLKDVHRIDSKILTDNISSNISNKSNATLDGFSADSRQTSTANSDEEHDSADKAKSMDDSVSSDRHIDELV
jgi:hypothetical protein